jgi:hypothetical protein
MTISQAMVTGCLILLSSVAVFSQAVIPRPQSTGVFGVAKDGLYVNSVFKFQLRFPSDWTVIENEDARELTKAGAKLLELDERVLEKDQRYRVALLTVLKREMGSPRNATITLSAMKQPSAAVNPLDLARISRKGLESSPAITFESEPSSITINGKQFGTFEYRATVGEHSTKGKYLVTMSGSYSITAFISNVDPADDKVVQEIVNSFKFN